MISLRWKYTSYLKFKLDYGAPRWSLICLERRCRSTRRDLIEIWSTNHTASIVESNTWWSNSKIQVYWYPHTQSLKWTSVTYPWLSTCHPQCWWVYKYDRHLSGAISARVAETLLSIFKYRFLKCYLGRKAAALAANLEQSARKK